MWFSKKKKRNNSIETPEIKAEPAKAAPVKAEPAKSEPVKAEPVQAEPAKSEPVKAAPAKAEPAKSEPVKNAEPVRKEEPVREEAPEQTVWEYDFRAEDLVYDAISDRRKAERRQTVRRTFAAVFFAFLFLMPTVLTFTNSFMTASEINANYGAIFAQNNSGGKVYVAETVNLKFIPDMVTFSQYITVLFKSPEYLMKFWNSVIYVVPIVIFQLLVASIASFGFARYRGKVKQLIFFLYIILMLMPYQVTLVPNFMVLSRMGIVGTRWAIWLPGIFSPFAVYMLTKYMRRIPYSLYEAAAIDGAGEWQIFTQICMPICRGGLASIAILIFIDYWNMVEQPLILLENEEMYPLSVFLSRINTGEISLAFAVAVIYMVLPMLFFLYGEEYLVEGILYQGGIKE